MPCFTSLHAGCVWRLPHLVMSARGASWCQSPSESFLGRLLHHHRSCVTGGLKEAVSWHICPPSSVPLWQSKNRSLNTQAAGWMTAWVSRNNLPQIRYSDGSFLHINSCVYGDYFGNLLLLLWKSVFPPQRLFNPFYRAQKCFLSPALCFISHTLLQKALLIKCCTARNISSCLICYIEQHSLFILICIN